MQGTLLLLLVVGFSAVCISGKDLEFNRYWFRRKSTWGRAVNRAERQCREDTCQSVKENLKRDICIRKCISTDCYQELYSWNELEEGERDIRWLSFKGCVAEELRKKNAARLYDRSSL